MQTLGVALISAASTPFIFTNCASSFVTYRTEVLNGGLIIPNSAVVLLKDPNGIMLVRSSSLPGPIVLRNIEGAGVVALSSICTHRGCEVRPMPHSLQCPCHGSEYDVFGQVTEGPATRPLTRYPIVQTSDSLVIKVG